MLHAKVEQALNDQINYELMSGYIYLSMAAWLKKENLNGFAHWMRIQAQEETFHAMKMFDYVHDRDGKVVLKEVAKPQGEWKSVLEVFKHAYAHEQGVTARLCNIADVATKNKDHVTNVLMQWFINEQIEEEANAKGFADQLKMIGASTESLFRLDREAAARQMSPMVAAGLGFTGGGAAAV